MARVTRFFRTLTGLALGLGLILSTAEGAPAPIGGLRTLPGFEEPLVPTQADPQADEAAFAAALERFSPDGIQGIASLEAFLAAHPDSRWRLAIETNAGLWYYREGYFSLAIAAWEDAWKTGRAQSGLSPDARALSDRAVGELIRMHARLGHAQRLKELLAEVEGHALVGPATEEVAGARQGLWMMDNDPGVAFLCGPNALRRVALLSKPATSPDVKLLERYRSGHEGVSLGEVGALAAEAHVALKPAYRLGDAPIPVPSVVHWKVSHYAAIVGTDGRSYHIQDPTFGNDLWVSRDAVEKESSGYFLIPKNVTAGWRDVTAAEARSVHGMGFTQAGDPNATRPDDKKTKPPCNNAGMCGYNAHDMNVSLNLVDTPVGYTPAVGPAVKVTLVYNQREARQPAVPTFFNFGAKWTSNWLGYVVDVPGRPGVNVMSYVRGGGAYDEAGYAAGTGKFLPEPSNYSVLRLVSSSPIQYERRFKDGSREVYATSDGSTAYPRRVFLTQVVDPAGNALALAYDASKRLTTVTDAVGRATKFTYGSAAFPLQPTKITDPFGRFASIGYDATGRLLSIKDVLGLTSTMTYDAGSFITKLTTPYGASTFAYTESGPDRTLDFTDPLGFTEHLESKQTAPGMPFNDPRGMPAGMDNDNQYLYYRNSFYWDKNAYSIAAGDYTRAKVSHWYHDLVNFNDSSAAMASMQNPLEGRVWLRTPNDAGLVSGTYNEPRQVGRILDDGTSQVTNLVYNKTGNLAGLTDPAGRSVRYDFASNGVDVIGIRRRGSSGAWVTVAQYTYNAQHRPLTCTDAAGQTTQYAYNAAGQLTSETDPLGQVASYEYDALGELTRVVNPHNKTAWSLTYDAFGRVATRTDSEGRIVAFGYDAFDRPTLITYPDATTEKRAYTNLDLTGATDRLNRTTSYVYDANRNLKSITDPALRIVSFGYFRNGTLQSMTDPKGNVTTWNRDLEGRVTSKVYADGGTETFAWETYGGRLKSHTDAAGRTQAFAYAVDNRIAGISYAGGTVAAAPVKFTYDKVFGRLVSMTDGTGTTTYRYGAAGAPGALALTGEDGPDNHDDIAYAYDALGRLTQRTIAGSTETFGFDALSRVVSDQNALGNVAYGYLGETEQIAGMGVGAAVGTSYGYAANSGDRRLASIASLGARGFQYSVNAEGLITGIVDSSVLPTRPHAAAAAKAHPAATRTTTPSYDAADRLLGEALSTGEHYAYGYDAADNITSWQTPQGNKSASYGATNQMTALAGASITVDAAGDVVEDAQRTYLWDSAGRLAEIAYKAQPGQKTDFVYDGLGRRVAIRETANGTTTETRYLWCGTRICQARDASDNVLRQYFDQGEYRSQAGTRSFYDRDHLGSVRDVSDVASGAVVASLDYDPYGNLVKSAGTPAATDFRYAGMFYHATSGLSLTMYRAYDPNAARWLSRDPVGESVGVNLYGYVKGNPANLTDSTGACPNCIGAAIGAGALGLLDFGVQMWRNGGDISCVNWWEVGGAAATGALIGFGLGELVAEDAAVLAEEEEATTVIGRVKDLQDLEPGEKSLLDRLPDQGSPKANWQQNSGVLRQEMQRGLPIRDASPGDTSGQFLNAERNLLSDRGWTFNPTTNYWMPPTP